MEALLAIGTFIILCLLIKSAIKGSFNKGKNKVTVRLSNGGSSYTIDSEGQNLLKEASALKKEKKYAEACDVLRKHEAVTGYPSLRLPMYLQLAGQSDEGWKVLNELNLTKKDAHFQAALAKQTRIFLQKEKKFRHAIVFGLWEICKVIERDRYNIRECFKMADDSAKFEAEYGSFDSDNRRDKIYAHTPKGNPVTDSSYEMFTERIEHDMSLDGVKKAILPHLKKAKAEASLDALSEATSHYLQSRKKYIFKSVQELTVEHIQA